MGNKFVPIGIVIIALLAILVVKPLVFEVRTTNAQAKAYQQQSGELQNKIDRLNHLKPGLANYQDRIAALKIAMPAAQQIPEVLVMVEDIAKKAGLAISGLDVQPSSGGGQVGVNMSAAGSYANLITFTSVLENNVRPIQIKSMSVSAGGSDAQTISASVSLGILYQGTSDLQVAK